MSKLHTTIEFVINGHSCEQEVIVHYDYSPPGGDGWNEPRYGASAPVCSVETVSKVDLTPLLTRELLDSLEGDCIENEESAREYLREEAAERRAEMLAEMQLED